MTGGTALRGRVRVTGAKNSALKLMAAALLAPGRTTIDEVPDILDVTIMSEVLRRLGCGVTYERTPGSGGGGRVVVDVPDDLGTETDYDLVRRMRAEIPADEYDALIQKRKALKAEIAARMPEELVKRQHRGVDPDAR